MTLGISQNIELDFLIPLHLSLVQELKVSSILADANYLYIGRINNKVLLYSTGNYNQYSVVNHNRKEYEKEYICILLNHFAVHQKRTQHCKSTILQLKKR